jgi:hypothetical protein
MTVITLTFTSSEEEIVSGIPRYVTIESNVPATIHYTLDGTTPTINSLIYIDPLDMPDGVNSVILSAFGIDGIGTIGPTLTQSFAPDTTRATIGRNVGLEGFVLDRADAGPDIIDRYGADGTAATFLDVDPATLDMIHKNKGFNGIADGTAINVSYPDPNTTASLIDNGFVPYSTPEKAEFFNPNARLIVIDNRLNNELHLTLRPFGSLSNIYQEFGGKRVRESADDATYISGGFVRRFYDLKKNVMVSYYFDHNESRYVKNIQRLPDNIQSANNIGVQSNAGLPLVFRWIYRGRQSSI